MGKKDKEIEVLNLKKLQTIEQLKRFEVFTIQFDETKKHQLADRIQKCEDLWEVFEDIQSKLEVLLEDQFDVQAQNVERTEFEDLYFAVLGTARSLFQTHCNKPNLVDAKDSDFWEQPQVPLTSASQAKLPLIEIPKFNGSYDAWISFHDIYSSVIHNNAQLNNTQQLYYLRSSLTGIALEIIESLTISEDNYKIAWNLLKDRFQNKPLIINNYLQSLFNIKSITRESPKELRSFLDEVKKILRGLEALKEPVNQWDTILIFLLSNKLDTNSKREWESSIINQKKITIDTFYDFMTTRCQLLENLKQDKASNVVNTPVTRYNTTSSKTQSYVTNEPSASCKFCKDNHGLFYCPKFLALSVRARWAEIKILKLCINCLRNHTSECLSSGCRTCGAKHNTLLHNSEPRQTECFSLHNESEVLLSTAIIYVLDKFGNRMECRALLDSGSQSSFITKELCTRLKINREKINVPIVGIGKAKTTISSKSNVTIYSRINSFNTRLCVLVVDRITDRLPASKIDPRNLNIPQNIVLADPTYHIPGKIDLLLGSEIFWQLLSIGQIKLNHNSPILQKTKCGWIIVGSMPYSIQKAPIKCNLSVLDLHHQLEKFWSLDSITPESPILSTEEKLCEKHFQDTTTRDENGRFCVSLPIKPNSPDLGTSFNLAVNRFVSLERKFKLNPEFKELYFDFIKQYKELNHMSKILYQPKNDNEVSYFLPHHGVLTESSQTTKLRTVFDASAKTSNGYSLNDKLLVGPKIQHDLFDILIRFREGKYVLIADIEKMFRQIDIYKTQRRLQRILWRDEPTEDISVYELNTVTYGTAAAPFLAVRCLVQIAMDNKHTNLQAKEIKEQLTSILKTYGFNLRKWLSNNQDVLINPASEEDPTKEYYIREDQTTRTLGLIWNAERDILQYSVNPTKLDSKITKRSILSTVSQVFDPLGLMGPSIVKAKCLIQRLWKLQVAWDESLPMDIHTEWWQLSQQLENLNLIQIPRAVMNRVDSKSIQIHCFSDASQEAYGCCLYIRSEEQNGIKVQLVCAKSRVAPLKQISIPRLELCGALLASQLASRVTRALKHEIRAVTMWTDSTIVLAWLNSEPTRWKTFVANRVSEIQNLTTTYQWRHIPGELNPADIISRGLNPDQLKENSLWWNGPSFLKQNESRYPMKRA